MRSLKFLVLLFLIAIICYFIYNRYRASSGELPASFYNFPIDSTVQIIQSMPSDVAESSGIIVLNDQVWTHNDSGDDPILYEMSIESGELLQAVELTSAKARDWEDVAQDSQFVYVSDMGNNAGKRRDLAIYKTAKEDLLDGNSTSKATKLSIIYPDRTDYKPPAYQHNFDCEAILAMEDSLYIFSKNHLDKHCRFYSAANDLSEQTIRLKDRFHTSGMITGAAIDKENKVLALLGYNLNPKIGNFGAFVWLFWDYPDRDFFKGKSKRVNMPVIAQAEGIGYWKDGQFLISTERSRIMRGKLMVFDAKKWMD
ncbi:MAG: hypothetical protein AAGJ18_23040 [Bacteroidota bacterium]